MVMAKIGFVHNIKNRDKLTGLLFVLTPSRMNICITTKNTIQVRKMSGREEELVDEMKRYGLEVLGVSEAKLRGNGVLKYSYNIIYMFPLASSASY